MKDTITVFTLSISLAMLVTSHVTTVYGLLLRPPRWRAVMVLLFPPLAPMWAWKERMFVRSVSFVLASVGYAMGVALHMN
jgi:hypothetical protein